MAAVQAEDISLHQSGCPQLLTRPAQLSTWSGKHSEQITRKKKKKSIHALQTNLCRDVYMGVVYTHIHRQESNFLTQSKCSHTTRRFQHNREVEVQFCTARTSHQQVKWWLYPPHRYCQQFSETSNHSSEITS